MKPRALAVLDSAARSGTIAGLVYAGVGSVDAVCHSASVSQVALVAPIYGVVGILAGVAALSCIRVIRGLRRMPVRSEYEGASAALWAVGGLVSAYAVIWLNRYLLIDYPWFSPVALALTLGLCTAVALVGLLVVRFAATRLAREAGKTSPALTWTFRLLPVVILLSATPSLRADRHTFPDTPKANHSLPNVVLLVSDCVRADHVSAYGYRLKTTPLFDQVAAEGVLFEDAHASASWTLPSVTGLLASTRAGVDVRPGVTGTDLKASTLPEILRKLGYSTYAASNNPHLGGRFGIASRFDVFDGGTTAAQRALDMTVLGLVRRRFLIDDGTMVDRTIEFLDSIPEPFFVYLHIMGGHAPYEYPRSYEPAFAIPATNQPITGPHANMRISTDQRENLVARYDVMIRYADDQLRRFVDALAERDKLGNTLLIYTADHGEEFGDHGEWTHGRSLHVETIRVPLAVRWPGHIPAGVRRTDLASLLDVGPSILGVLPDDGAAVPDEWQGIDLRLTTTAPSLEPRVAISELGPSLRALITPRWKYVLDMADGSVELYDRRADPEERRNVATAEPQVLEGLASLLREELERGSSALEPSSEAAPASPALIEQLRALGYVE